MLLIFLADAALFPALPEVFIVGFYFLHPALGMPPLPWALALLGVALVGDVAGNALLYGIVKAGLVRTKRMPGWLDRAMKKWTSLLLVRDERVILVNRIAPAVPLTGAFIAVCGWSLRRSLAYVVLGGALKYSVLLVLTGVAGLAFSPDLARTVTLVAVVGFVGASLVAGRLRARRMGAAR